MPDIGRHLESLKEPSVTESHGENVWVLQDPDRLAAVSATELLDSRPEELFDRVTRLAARLLDVPITLISVVDRARDFYKSMCGIEGASGSDREVRGATLCRFAIQQTTPLVIPDVAANPRYCDLPNVRRLGVGAYLGVPLVIDDQPVGTLCAVDLRRHDWTDEDIEVLAELAASIQREVQLRSSMATTQRVMDSLKAHRRELELSNDRLHNQATELELSNQQLHEQAVELEIQTEQLTNTSAALEERTVLAEHAKHAAENAEQQLQAAFSQAPASIAVTMGPQHTFIIANAHYEQLIGRPVRLGATFRDTLPELVDQGYCALLDNVYATGEAHFEREAHAKLDKGGETLEDGWYDFVYQPLTDADGRVVGVMQLGIDVTTQVRARRDAETANRAKGEFLTIMSHELRTPLNAIGGYAELLEMGIHGPLNDDQRNAIERIQRSSRHLLGLINGVLNYAKVGAAAVHYERDDVPLDEVLATCEALIAPQVRAKRLELSYTHCDHTLTARADREKVQQIVLNLLSNAVKFTEPGGRVTMTCAKEGEQIVIRLTDTGLGIAEDQIDRIFQPFVQIDAKLTRTHEGTGLGLAISRDLARGMGGELVVESTLGAGSTFVLTLPA